MIHLFFWLAGIVGVSFAAFLYLAFAVFLYVAGAVGRSIGAALTVGSLLWWFNPGLAYTALSLWGVATLIVAGGLGALWLIRRMIPTHLDTYRAAVRKARKGNPTDLTRWWDRRNHTSPTDRLVEALPTWLRRGDGIDWAEVATPLPPKQQRQEGPW